MKLLELNNRMWSVYKYPIKEFQRQGCNFHQQVGRPVTPTNREALFQIYDNCQYQLCSTYPGTLVFPAQASQSSIYESSRFRSSNRLPALSFFDRVSGASIWRCSQPQTFLFGTRNRGDEELVRCIGLCNDTKMNVTGFVEVFDARPQLSAKANKLKGGGYEDCGPSKAYSNCKISFGDIDNIHVVRESFEKVHEMVYTEVPTEKSSS